MISESPGVFVCIFLCRRLRGFFAINVLLNRLVCSHLYKVALRRFDFIGFFFLIWFKKEHFPMCFFCFCLGLFTSEVNMSLKKEVVHVR